MTDIEICSNVHEKNLVRWAEDKPKVVVLSADLTNSTEIGLFRRTYPNRFFSLGIAEQNMVSFAGGLSREGFIPFVHTFAVFLYRRAYDQIAMSVAYPNLPVKLFGFLPGVTTPGGATHQAIEDIAVMRALPNMTVLECGDAADVESVPDIVYGLDGPVYVRMLRGDIPRLFGGKMRLGQARLLSQGTELALLSSGICTQEALRAVAALKKTGVSVGHLHISTLKPFNDSLVMETLSRARGGVITMENHTIIGGLGSAAAELMAENGIAKRLIRIGLQDTFLHGASRGYLMKEYGIDAPAVIKAAGRLLNKKIMLPESPSLAKKKGNAEL
ncbi:MAG: transketolase C-terminal domain-containing protein [Candidatus Omnitrophota bacterium]